MKIKSLIGALFFVLALPVTYGISQRGTLAVRSQYVAYSQAIDCSHTQGGNCISPTPNVKMERNHHNQSGPTPSNNSGMPDFGAGSGLLALGLAIVVWLRLR